MIMTRREELTTMVTYVVRGATKPGDDTPGVAPAGTAVAFLQGFKQHTAKDRHLTWRSISLMVNMGDMITHSLHFQLQVESRLFLEAGLALRSHSSPTEGLEGGLSVTVFLCP